MRVIITFEIKIDDDTDPSMILDEAIESAERFAGSLDDYSATLDEDTVSVEPVSSETVPS